MAKTIHTGRHARLVEVLMEARRHAGLKQAELAARIGRDQSFVSLIEGGQRRVDVIEFLNLSKALDRDPRELFSEVVDRVGDTEA